MRASGLATQACHGGVDATPPNRSLDGGRNATVSPTGSRQPAHVMVSTALRAEIDQGTWKPGNSLPSEHALCEQYGVSRTTVRHALQSLEASNLVHRRQGSGTYVAERQLSHGLGDLRSFTQVIIDRGWKPGTLQPEIDVDPDPPVEALDFLPGSVMWRVRRLRTADDRLFSLADSWLPAEVANKIDSASLGEHLSLYRVLEEELGLRLHIAVESIRAEAARSEEAELLEVPHGSPIIVIYRWTRDARGAPVEFARSASPGDRHEYVVTLTKD